MADGYTTVLAIPLGISGVGGAPPVNFLAMHDVHVHTPHLVRVGVLAPTLDDVVVIPPRVVRPWGRGSS